MANAEFRPCPSRWLRYYLAVSHCLALVFTLLMPLPLSWRLLFASLVSGSWLWLAWAQRSDSPPVISIRDGNWFLGNRDNEQPATLMEPHYASDWLLVFRLRLVCGADKTVLVAKDSLDPDDFRRLRASLRLTPKAEQNC